MKTTKQILKALELPYSRGLMLQYGFVKERDDAPRVMTVMQRVADQPIVAKYRAQLGSLEKALRHMSTRQIAAIRRAVR
jgi:hypothetical protein